jgi:hypothetical protein
MQIRSKANRTDDREQHPVSNMTMPGRGGHSEKAKAMVEPA